MPNVTQEEIDSMKRMREILEGKIPSNPVSNKIDSSESTQKDAMKAILEKFYAASNGEIVDREMRNALLTEETDTGARFGSWEIHVSEYNKSKTYSITNIHTSENIASDLSLYESAMALVKLFNRGVGINTAQVREILNLEETYIKHRNDAITFKRKMKRLNEAFDYNGSSIAEDRYDEAKNKALAAKDRLRRINESL